MIEVLKSKIHHARVSDREQDYVGSIFIDEELLKLSGISKFEKVQVINVTNGQRWETYAYPSKKKGLVSVRGGAAHLCEKGDKLIIVSYEIIDKKDLVRPKIILVNEENKFLRYIGEDDME